MGGLGEVDDTDSQSLTFISHPYELVLTLIVRSLSIIDQQSHSFNGLWTHYHHTLSKAKPTDQL